MPMNDKTKIRRNPVPYGAAMALLVAAPAFAQGWVQHNDKNGFRLSHPTGWMVETPKASMYIWARIPEPYRALGSLEFAKQMLAKAKVSVSPGIGFGDHGDDHVRFALIENKARIRQGVRGIKAMFRADGLVQPA